MVVVAGGDREEDLGAELVGVARLGRPIGVVLLEHDGSLFAELPADEMHERMEGAVLTDRDAQAGELSGPAAQLFRLPHLRNRARCGGRRT